MLDYFPSVTKQTEVFQSSMLPQVLSKTKSIRFLVNIQRSVVKHTYTQQDVPDKRLITVMKSRGGEAPTQWDTLN